MTIAVLLALLPVAMLIGLGSVLRWRRFLADEFWPQAERLCYMVLMPCLFVHGLATADLTGLPFATIGIALIAATIGVAVAMLLLRPVLCIDGPAFTSVFQGGIRFNNYVGVTLAAGLFGVDGVALAAICNAAIVPTVNILCVLVFARHGSARLSPTGIARQLATNPLILSSLAGITAQAAGISLPAGIGPALQALGAAALPLGLLCVGSALNPGPIRRWARPVIIASVIKFGVMPAATLAVALPLGLHGPGLTTALLFQTLPTASSAYVMARQLGGDAPLMATITALQTALSLVAIPLILIALQPWT